MQNLGNCMSLPGTATKDMLTGTQQCMRKHPEWKHSKTQAYAEKCTFRRAISFPISASAFKYCDLQTDAHTVIRDRVTYFTICACWCGGVGRGCSKFFLGSQETFSPRHQQKGQKIPTPDHHKWLKPFGACFEPFRSLGPTTCI